MWRKKMTIDLPFFMGRSRGMKSPFISVTTDERRTDAPFGRATRDGAVTSAGISQGVDSVFVSVEVEYSLVRGDDDTTEKRGRICFVAEIEKATECCANSDVAAIADVRIRIVLFTMLHLCFIFELSLCNAYSDYALFTSCMILYWTYRYTDHGPRTSAFCMLFQWWRVYISKKKTEVEKLKWWKPETANI